MLTARQRAQAKYHAKPEVKARARAQYLARRGIIRAHNATPERRAARKRAWQKWYDSPKGRAARLAYQRSSVGRTVRRRHGLKKLYGLSEAAYTAMLTRHGGGCAICGERNANGRPLFVDHHHASNRVRALLCLRCNSVIGHCCENVAILERAIAYLRQHEKNNPLTKTS